MTNIKEILDNEVIKYEGHTKSDIKRNCFLIKYLPTGKVIYAYKNPLIAETIRNAIRKCGVCIYICQDKTNIYKFED